jgi:hypothetical protein
MYECLRRLAQAGRENDAGVDAPRHAPKQPARGTTVVQTGGILDVADDARPGAAQGERHRGSQGVADVEVGVQEIRSHLRERGA